MIQFIGNIQNKDRKLVGGCQELRQRGMTSDSLMGMEFSFKVLKCFAMMVVVVFALQHCECTKYAP